MSAKCPILKRPYPPGHQSAKRRGRRNLSGYGRQLREKQKLRNFYNLKEYQFKKYVKDVLDKRGKVEDTQTFLIKKLEKRLDNVVFKLGFASSRVQARQLVGHGHFLVNGKKVNIPSFQTKKGDEISIKSAKDKVIFHQLPVLLKQEPIAPWLKIDIKKLQGKIVAEPCLEDAAPPAEISAIFEFYSR